MAEMKNQFGEIMKKLKQDKKALLTVVVGLIGMTLVLLSELPSAFDGKTESVADTESQFYNDDLERETERLISQIEGAGKVSVMLTYEATEETVWARDVKTGESGNDNTDKEEKYIIMDTSQGESGLAVKVLYPKIRGVAVVCSGGEDPIVNSRIKALVSALFDIGSNRISIARRAEQE